ncbi:SGNH/GDSL hydrolase family protein [Actinosynnema sp. NPDC023794]
MDQRPAGRRAHGPGRQTQRNPRGHQHVQGLRRRARGAVLSKPAPRDRQIEFIGDSLTVGYGNVSGTRDCNPEQLKRNTNTDVSYSALTARQLDADYQINGFSGLGMVRNVAGISPDVTYRTYYDRALLNVDGDVWQNPGTWRPQIVVVNLGANDFSDLTPGEP